MNTLPRCVLLAAGAVILVAACGTADATDRDESIVTGGDLVGGGIDGRGDVEEVDAGLGSRMEIDDDAGHGRPGTLLIERGGDSQPVLVAVDLDGGGEEPVSLPQRCAAGCPARATITGRGSNTSYVVTGDGTFSLDHTSGSVQFVERDSRVFTSRPVNPRYLIAHPDEARVTVVDLASGSSLQVDVDGMVQHVSESIAGLVISPLGGPSLIVDPAEQTVTVLDEELLVLSNGVSSSGRQLAAIERADDGRHLVVIDVERPDDRRRWYTSKTLVAEWLGDRMIVGDAVDGALSLVDEHETHPIADLAPGALVVMRILPDPSGEAAFVMVEDRGTVTSHRFDATDNSIEALADVDGLRVSSVGHAEGFVLLDDQGEEPELQRLVAVPVRQGPALELVTSEEPVAAAAVRIDDHRLYVRALGGAEVAWIVDLTTGARVETIAGRNVAVSSDGSWLAMTIGTAADSSAVIVATADPSIMHATTPGRVVGWLQG